MISIDFVRTRAQRTYDAQNSLSTDVPWVWDQKTVLQWSTDITLVDQLVQAESAKRAQLRNVTALWQANVDQILAITRQVAGLGRVRFRKEPAKKHSFDALNTNARSRTDIYTDGLAARDAWQEVDPEWEISEAVTAGALGSLLANCLYCLGSHSAKLQAWRFAAAKLNEKAAALDADNVAWYEEATRRFLAGTAEGDMIRSTVPTTARPEQAVGQAVISNLMVAGGDIHFDCAAPHATRYTYLQQAPGSATFLVVELETTEAHLTLHGQPAGVHRFKAVGKNSRGEGPESAVVEVTVAASNVA